MKGLIIATRFLTRLPTPRVTVSDEDFVRSMRWFPAVGIIVGLLVCLGAMLGARIDPWIGALAGLAIWVLITGALHLDGLGDVADACGAAHKDRDKLLGVLADPHVGSFAVVAIGLQLAAKLVLLRVLLDSAPPAALILVPFAARIGPLAWAWWLTPLHQGLGARFRDGVRRTDIGLWIAALLLASWFVPALLAALAFIPLWGAWLKHKLGGISGDGHGSGIELVETGLLLAIVTLARFA